MDITVKIDFPALDRLVVVLEAQISGVNTATPTTAAPDKPARTAAKDRTTQASATPVSEASQEPKGSSPTEPEGQSPTGDAGTAEASKSVDYKDVKKMILDLVAKKGREAAVALLKDFDATKGEEIDAARWGAFIFAGEAVLDA